MARYIPSCIKVLELLATAQRLGCTYSIEFLHSKLDPNVDYLRIVFFTGKFENPGEVITHNYHNIIFSKEGFEDSIGHSVNEMFDYFDKEIDLRNKKKEALAKLTKEEQKLLGLIK